MSDQDEIRALFTLSEIEALLMPELLAAMEASLTGATREEILAAATKAAGEMATMLVDTATDTVLQTVKEGLRDQVGIPEIRRRIKDTIGLDPKRAEQLMKYQDELEEAGEYTAAEIRALVEQRKDKLLTQRAEAIARTETRRATEAGEMDVMIKRGNTHKMSISVGDSRVSDVCEACEAEGVIPIDATYSASGAAAPPHHPNCRCTNAWVKDTGSGEVKRANARQQKRANETAAAKKRGEDAA